MKESDIKASMLRKQISRIRRKIKRLKAEEYRLRIALQRTVDPYEDYCGCIKKI